MVRSLMIFGFFLKGSLSIIFSSHFSSPFQRPTVDLKAEFAAENRKRMRAPEPPSGNVQQVDQVGLLTSACGQVVVTKASHENQ